MHLFPRIDRMAADELLETCKRDGKILLPVIDEKNFPLKTRYAASGGRPVQHRVLKELRDTLVGIAGNYGFPEAGTTSQRTQFDKAASVCLAQFKELDSGEALRDDVWAFLACVILPDLVVWRFPGQAPERFHGGVRNTFQRLWIRGRILDRGTGAEQRWELLDALTEDALVQITERPSISNDIRLSHALAEGWLRASRRGGEMKMEKNMREATIKLRLRNQVQLLSVLDDQELEETVDVFFSESLT